VTPRGLNSKQILHDLQKINTLKGINPQSKLWTISSWGSPGELTITSRPPKRNEKAD